MKEPDARIIEQEARQDCEIEVSVVTGIPGRRATGFGVKLTHKRYNRTILLGSARQWQGLKDAWSTLGEREVQR